MLQTARRIAWCSHRRGRAAPCRALSDYHVPGLVLSARRVFTQEDVDAFLQLTGDANPIHRRHGGANAVVPGLLCASLFPGIIGSNFAGSLYLKQQLSFRSPVYVGDEVEATVEFAHVSGQRAKLVTTCKRMQCGTVAVDGQALARLPAVLARGGRKDVSKSGVHKGCRS
mmetsp:Transcript_11405/g.41740  ORF Transcript_11405/g.41740 Transcript_11405/m.41740 type:complete len:170 (-) Transcript_11405:608-1117(-)